MPSNPFYSERLQQEIVIRAARPSDLPETSMDTSGLPLLGQTPPTSVPVSYGPMFDTTGKGRGNGSSGEMVFSSMEQQRQGHPVTHVLRTEGQMPGPDVTKGVVPPNATEAGKGRSEKSSESDEMSLQRALEGEVANLLRQQNLCLHPGQR